MNPDAELLPGEENEISQIVSEAGERLDVFCARLTGETRSYARKLMDRGAVLLNGAPGKPAAKLKVGDAVCVTLPELIETQLVPQNLPLNIVYQDADIAVIDKPQGMVVHPAPGNETGTLVNAILYHIKDLSGIGGELRPGIVHRIDKLTSGLIVIAKNDAAHRSLAAQIKEHSAARVYIAIVEGNIREDGGTVDAPIGRHLTDRKRMAVTPQGREAQTNWRVLERMGAFTLVEARLTTGRTHQIRVHMAYMRHPVAGDTVYGPDKPKLGLCGQALHAARLALTHPSTGERMVFCAPVPEYFCRALLRAGLDPDVDVEKLLVEKGV